MGAAPIVVVANPAAGNGKAGKIVGKVDHLLGEAGIPHEIVLSTSGPDLQERVRAAAAGGAPAVGCIGGDGTVGLAANGLIGTDTTLAVFPSGTADDFAHAIGLRNLETAVKALAAGPTVRIDTAKVTTSEATRRFVAVASCGFDSEVNEAANAMTVRLGSTGTYVAALVKTLSTIHAGAVHDRRGRGDPHRRAYAGRGGQLDQLRWRHEGDARMPRWWTASSMRACSGRWARARSFGRSHVCSEAPT